MPRPISPTDEQPSPPHVNAGGIRLGASSPLLPLALCVVLSAVSVGAAAADGPPRDGDTKPVRAIVDPGRSEPGWPTGTMEWAILGGLGPGTVFDPPRTSVTTAQMLLRWAYHFGPMGRDGRRGNLAFLVEAVPLYTIDQEPRAYGGGVNLGLRYTLRRGSWMPSILAGVGALGTNDEVPPGEARLNFTPQGGVGLQYLLRPRLALGIEYRFHHLSNASRTESNPGINTHLVLVGLSWYR